jgi:hypothetical protein
MHMKGVSTTEANARGGAQFFRPADVAEFFSLACAF